MIFLNRYAFFIYCPALIRNEFVSGLEQVRCFGVKAREGHNDIVLCKGDKILVGW